MVSDHRFFFLLFFMSLRKAAEKTVATNFKNARARPPTAFFEISFLQINLSYSLLSETPEIFSISHPRYTSTEANSHLQ